MLARKLWVCLLSSALWCVSEEEMQVDCSCSSEQKRGWSRSPVGVAEELVSLVGRCSSLPLAALQGMLQQPRGRSRLAEQVMVWKKKNKTLH